MIDLVLHVHAYVFAVETFSYLSVGKALCLCILQKRLRKLPRKRSVIVFFTLLLTTIFMTGPPVETDPVRMKSTKVGLIIFSGK